jgi:4-diphosphocytidyl-2-C-methyl-D-erythritol kinase
VAEREAGSPPAPREVTVLAHAKINVALRVLGRRADGYHDLESLVIPISLADRVRVRRDDRLHVETTGAAPRTGQVPAGGLNLALVAALALADACPDAGGALVEIDKRIPVAAGLGGGSADAAATLLALNELWGCGLDPATLAGVAERIGSDVPAMLAGGPVLMSGRGELLAPASCSTFWWVVVSLGFGVRSPDAYRWWDEDGGVRGPDPDPVLRAAEAGDPSVLGPLLFNDLEPSVVGRHPEVEAAKARLLERGCAGAVMIGSGSSVVGLVADREQAEAVAAAFDDAVVASGPAAERG